MNIRETDVLTGKKLDDLCQEMKDTVLRAVREDLPLHEVEKLVWRQVLRIGHAALGQLFALLGNGDQGETVELPDGRRCERLEQEHTRRYVSIFGEFELARAVYGSREGQKIEFVPLDNRLQLPESVFSYVLQDWDQSFCAEQAFGPSAAVIQKILGLRESVDSLEHMNLEMSQQVLEFWQTRPQPTAEEEGAILVTSADGKGIVMRRSEKDEPTRAHRHKGEKASSKRMATVGAVYTVNPYVRTPEQMVAMMFRDGPEPAEKRPQPQGKRVWAWLPVELEQETIPGMDFTYTWLQEEVQRRNPAGTKPLVHLCDGQECLWKARDEYLPQENAVNILDVLHMSSRVWQAAHVFHAEGSDAAAAFVRERLLKILQGKSERVVRGLRELGSKRGLTGAKKKTLRTVCGDLAANRERMRYDEYLAAGYPIASGVIEGACRHLVKDRMERAGMHWTPAGAQAMLDVRSIYVNGEWENYQAFWIEQETKRLYAFRAVVEGPSFAQAV